MARAARNPRLEAIRGRMSRMDTVERPKAAKLMVYGGPGSGKTFLTMGIAQQLKGDGDILFVDARDGWVSLEPYAWATEDVIYSGEYFPASELAALANALEEDKRTGSGPLANVNVIQLDEYSTWYKTVLEDAATKRLGAAARGDDNLPEIIGTDHGPASQIMEAVLDKFGRIPGLHVLIVAHAREKAQKVPGASDPIINYAPNFPPLSLVNISATLHSMAFLGVKIDGAGHYIRTVTAMPTSRIMAKSRIPGMSAKMDPSDYVENVVAWLDNSHYDEATPGSDDIVVEPGDELIADGDEQAKA